MMHQVHIGEKEEQSLRAMLPAYKVRDDYTEKEQKDADEIIKMVMENPEFLDQIRSMVTRYALEKVHLFYAGKNQLPADGNKSYNDIIVFSVGMALAKHFKIAQHYIEYKLALMSHEELKEETIEFECSDEGLKYRVIGLDNLQNNGVIQWSQLSKDFPKNNDEILATESRFLPEILKVIIPKIWKLTDHTLTQEEQNKQQVSTTSPQLQTNPVSSRTSKDKSPLLRNSSFRHDDDKKTDKSIEEIKAEAHLRKSAKL